MENIKSMDREQLRHELMDTAEELMKLADSLSSHGTALTAEQKALARMGLTRWLRVMQAEAQSFFMSGFVDDFKHNQRHVADTLEDLS